MVDDPPEGFSFDPPQQDLPQGFSYQPPSQMQSQQPVNQTDWRGMLDNMSQTQALPPQPRQQEQQAVEVTQQGGGWRDLLDQLNPIGTAEARGARKPPEQPSTVQPAQPGDPASGTTRQGPNGPEMWDLDKRQWVPFQQFVPGKRGPKTGRETPAGKHERSVTEYETKLWEEAQRHKLGTPKETPPPWFDEEGNFNKDKLFDPKYGLFPWNYMGTYEKINQEERNRIDEAAKQIKEAKEKGEPAGIWPAINLLSGGAGYAMSPITAGARSIAGQPLENVTGFPKEYTEFAMQLGIPGLGLPRTAAMARQPLARSQFRTLQKEASIDPLAVGENAPWMKWVRANPPPEPGMGEGGILTRNEPGRPRLDQGATGAEKPGNQLAFRQRLADMMVKPQVPGYRPEGQTLQTMQWFEKTFSPETAGPTAQDASASLREYLGMGEREAAQAYDMMNRGTMWGKGASFYKQVEQAGEAPANSAYKKIPGWNSKDELAAYLDGSPKAVKPDPASPMGQIAYKTRQAIEKTTAEWKKTLDPKQQEYVRDKYLKHKWKNWTEAGTGRAAEGSRGPLAGAKMAERSQYAKDYAMGRENGLVPAFDNPLDAAMDSIVEMRRDITQHNMIEEGKSAGTVRSAEGPMVSALLDNGYVALAGQRGLYAPENWARIYNNFYDSGFRGLGKSALDTARHFTNASTQFLLGLSAYHAFTMGEATMGTQLARVFANMGHQGLGNTFLDALEVPFAPLTYYGRGAKAQTGYLHNLPNEQAQRAVNYLNRANWRPLGRSAFTPDIIQSKATEKFGTFAESARRGTFFKDLQAGGFVGNIGRVLDQINAPLFQHYIPRVKAGVNLRRMQDVLDREPGLSDTEYLARARDIVNSTDNRFGEMVQDNIFWNRSLKQSLMLGMLSYSWTMGGIREWGGGARDISRYLTAQAVMSPKAQYVIASSMVWGIMNTIAMKMHTGFYPWDEPTLTDPDGKPHKLDMWQGLMGGYTGGWENRYIPPNPKDWGKPFAKGERVWEPQQIRVPGYMKDIIGFMHHPLVELEGKIGSGVRNLWELFRDQDYFGRPIFEPRSKINLMDQIPRWAKNAWDHTVDTSFPITLQNLGVTGKPGNPMTGLSKPEIMMGMQPAQSVLANPYQELTRQYFETKKWEEKQASEAAARRREEEMKKRKYQGPNP